MDSPKIAHKHLNVSLLCYTCINILKGAPPPYKQHFFWEIAYASYGKLFKELKNGIGVLWSKRLLIYG